MTNQENLKAPFDSCQFHEFPSVVDILKRFLQKKSKNEVAAVLTQPDRKSGRGKNLKPSPVKPLSEKEGLQIIQPKSLKNNPEYKRSAGAEKRILNPTLRNLSLDPENV